MSSGASKPPQGCTRAQGAQLGATGATGVLVNGLGNLPPPPRQVAGLLRRLWQPVVSQMCLLVRLAELLLLYTGAGSSSHTGQAFAPSCYIQQRSCYGVQATAVLPVMFNSTACMAALWWQRTGQDTYCSIGDTAMRMQDDGVVNGLNVTGARLLDSKVGGRVLSQACIVIRQQTSQAML